MKTLEENTALPAIQLTTERDLLHWPWVSPGWHILSRFRTVPLSFPTRIPPCRRSLPLHKPCLGFASCAELPIPEEPKLALLP